MPPPSSLPSPLWSCSDETRLKLGNIYFIVPSCTISILKCYCIPLCNLLCLYFNLLLFLIVVACKHFVGLCIPRVYFKYA